MKLFAPLLPAIYRNERVGRPPSTPNAVSPKGACARYWKRKRRRRQG